MYVLLGMSGDYEPAIVKGATSVRVGSLIFGPRLYATNTAATTASFGDTTATAAVTEANSGRNVELEHVTDSITKLDL